jgi:phosphoglycerol transferase MdoB-like AlkP superfamily enzyme
VWFILRYWLAVILFFEIARVFFLLGNWKETKALGMRTALLTLRHGLIMDLSMATYIILPMIVFCILSVFIRVFRRPVVYQVYTGLVLLMILFLLVTDVAMYQAWGFRLDATPLKYMKNPKEAWASVQHLPLFRGAVVFLIVYLVLLWGNNRFIGKGTRQVNHNGAKGGPLLMLLLLAGISIIPLRGGIQLSPINQSTVYFSPDNYANQAALNAPWNLVYSLNHAVEDDTNPYKSVPFAEAKFIVDSLFTAGGIRENFIDLTRTPAPNVIIIIWEGFTYKVVDAKKDGQFITPRYNALKNEGVYFSNLYATGDRTDKGLAGVLSGYPSQPMGSIVKIPAKAARLPMLSKEFQKRHYHTSFYYGGETEFANMKAYLVQGGFQQFTSINDFSKADQNSKWGAHDEVVMKRMYNDLAVTKEPFFSTWLTLSSHEPFEVPVPTVIRGDDDESLYFNSLHYTDSIVNELVQKLKTSAVWNNTLIVIVPDHGTRMPATGFKGDDFKIGMLFLGGALSKTGLHSNKLGGQTDLAATLTGQLGYKNPFPWSRDLADPAAKEWAFFSFNNGFGYVQPMGTVLYDNTGKRLMQQQGATTANDLRTGKAILQSVYQDYLDK